MTQIAQHKGTKVSHHALSRRTPPASATGWLEELRRGANGQFDRAGFPGTAVEAWRHTNLKAIADTAFEAATGTAADAAATAGRYSFGKDAVVELVFVDGNYEPTLSRVGELPKGVKAMGLSQAVQEDAERVKANLAHHASTSDNPFVALNTGQFGNGAYVFLPRSTTIDRPIHLVYVSTGGKSPTVNHPRALIIAEDNVEATVVESYIGTPDSVYWTNAVTEFVIGADCRIDHTRLQQQSTAAYHIGTMQAILGRSSKFVSQAGDIGGRIVRNDLNVVMAGEFADATLNGLVLIDGNQHVDNHTLLDHAAPNCPSHELYKHVIGGKASGVFKGQIKVRQIAQKTDSKQTSKTLLISDDAHMDSMPALEIYADDVKCTHGSTIGPVDEDLVFYLRSRGVGVEAARHLLNYAFAADITRRIKVEPVRRRLEDYMAAKEGLPLDLRITDVGAHDDAVVM